MGRCKGTILLSLRNEQNDYAYCMKNLEKIQKEEAITGENNIEMCIFPYTILDIQSVKKMVVEGRGHARLNGLVKLDEYNILFNVLCNDSENDIVNLQFFFLTKKWLTRKVNVKDERIGLYIKSSQTDKKEVHAFHYKATEFLTYQCTEKTPYFIDYWRKNGKDVKQIEPKSDVILRKFSPLIEIVDSENMGIEYWQQSMDVFFKRCREKNIFWEKISSITVLNADKDNAHRQKKVELEDQIKNSINRQREACKDWDYRLLLFLKEYFCTNKVKTARKRMAFCDNIEFKERIKEMSLLSFYIFCLFEYNSAANKEKVLDYEEDIIILSQMILKMRDIGDGFFQLMLNTIEHSEFATGYFYFRIHDTSDKKYLKNKYRKYVDAQKDRTDFFLEMQIVDYSTLSVPDKFMCNMRKRALETDEEEDKRRYSELIKEGRQINLATFFRPNEEETIFWGKYYKITDNIVHHYGLQLFDSVIDSNEGCFLAISTPEYRIVNVVKNLYCSFEPQTKVTEEYYIPGTQYSALLPLRYVEKTEYTAVNADINYTELVSQSFEGKQLRNVSEKKIAETLKKYDGDLHQIEKVIKEISANLVENKSNNYIYYSDIAENDLSSNQLEIFCKILIRFISKRKENERIYIALLNCDDKCMIEITRIFSVFYNKQGISSVFDNVQIYLSGVNPENAFLFAGSDIAMVLNRAERLAIAYGIQPDCITILTNMLQRKAVNCSLKKATVSNFAIAPFELVKYGKKERLFNSILNNILKNDICKMKTGCLIPNTHVRLGSKIHITEFYQAEILFQNNYFTTRFAYLVAEDISSRMRAVDNLVLVGYETYSEMLCYEIVELLKRGQGEKKDIQYLIYEQKNGESFRYIEGLRQKKHYSLIFIVPINSTLTTHNKMQAALNRVRGKIDSVIENYGILLFCPKSDDDIFRSIQEQYGWCKIKDTEIETSLVEGGRVKFFFQTEVKWENALECECCFPKDRYDKEQPLIETNKASIIPMQKLELIESDRKQDKQIKQIDKEEADKIEALSQCMIYSHVERNGNHFNYYFQTEHFFRQNKDSIVRWLRKMELTDNMPNDIIVFNIIVSPQHYSNNGFVVEVNRNVFHNASLVLNIEVNKEFRSNIKAKYSNLLLLYNNLEKCGRRAEICFHYVDDSIISGATFYRAKSIIRSIFPKSLGQIVKVKIFASVILLLNRTSSFSKMNYQESNFYSYANLQISSLRTQEDACILCNIVKDAQIMEEMSSTETMSRYWGARKIYHRCKSIREINLSEINEEKRERAKRRLVCSHRANQVLNEKVHNWGEISEIKSCIITELLCKDSGKMKTEWQLSYIKTLSRPFFSFSSGIRKATFEIMLQLLDYMLGNNSLKETNPELEKLLNDIDQLKECDDYRMRYILLLTLIKRLSDLGSTFIIRKDNIARILKYYKTIEQGDYKRDFLLKYRACIKKLISLSGDEIKATWLEYLLINGKEYSDMEQMETEADISKEVRDFYDMLYMENTRILRDAVWDLTKKKRNEIEQKLKENEKAEEGQKRLQEENILIDKCYIEVERNYYLNNFKMIYDWNFKNNIKVLDAVCRLYLYLKYGTYVCTDIQEYYNELADILKAATQAKHVQIIICDEANEPNLLGDSDNTLNENRVLDELKEMIEGTVNYIDNSYYVATSNRAGVLKFSREHVGNVIPKSNVYFGFAFDCVNQDRMQVIRRLRNVLAFRNEFVHKFEMDFETDAIQQFLISMNQNKLLTGSGTIDHSYAKTRAQFLLDSRHIVEKWQENEPMLHDLRNQVGYFYYTVANSIISRLFQKAVVGKYDGSINASSIVDDWLNTTFLGEEKCINLYERNEQCKQKDGTLKKCSIQIAPEVSLERYFTYSTGDFTLSAIFILLTVNAGKHTKYGDVCVKVSIREWEMPNEYKLVFTNLWDRDNDGAQEEIEAINRQINEANHDSLHGITLWTLNKYFRFHTRNSNKVERGVEVFLSFENDLLYFNVAMPVYTKEE